MIFPSLLFLLAAAAPVSPSDLPKLQAARNVGLAALEEGNLAEAAKRFETVRQLAPEDPLGFCDGAVAAMRQKDLDTAARLLARALQLAPSDPRVLALEGTERELAGDTAGAIAAYEKAVAAAPRDLVSRWSVARLRGEGSRRRAIADIEAALREAPANLFLLVRIAELLRQEGDTAGALAVHDRLAVLVAGDPKLDQALAQARQAEESGDTQAASLKYRIVENLLRSTPRYQQARHDVEPGIVGLPLEDWGPVLAAALAARASAPIPVTFASAEAGLAGVRGASTVRVAGGEARDLVISGAEGLRVARGGRGGFQVAPPIPGSAASDVAVADVLNSGQLDLITPGTLWAREGEEYRKVAIAPGERVIPFDVDADGDLDLYVSSKSGDHLLRNNLDGSWTDITASSGLPKGLASRGAVAADFDRDGDIDLLVLRESGGFALFDNLRGGRLQERASNLPGTGSLRAAAAGDLNGDGRVDLVWTGDGGAFVALNRGDGTFLPARPVGPGAVALLFDFDNDGALDLFLANPGGASTLWRNDGVGNLTAVPGAGAFPPAVDAEAIDFDGDGDLDLALVTPKGGALILENRGGNANGWIDVALEGLPTGSAKVNRLGYGSEIEAKAQELYVYRVASRAVTHLGLGARRKADVLRIVWTNGVPQNRLDPPVKAVAREVQQLKGSCPFLYAFDGARWHFVTDVLGRSPAGLLFDGVHQAAADTREWLVVPGAVLAPSHGKLTLDFTEELWETAYFDLAELRAVDHPASVTVVSNEKMVAPPFPAKELFTISHALTPAAIDGDGRDRTAEIAAEDGVFLAGFAPTRYQGIVAPHDLILELPEARAPGRRPALPDRLDLLRGHLDQRLVVAALRPEGAGSGARGAGREGRLEDRHPGDGISRGKDQDDAGRPVDGSRPVGPARADPHQSGDLLGSHRVHGRRGSSAAAGDSAPARFRHAVLPRLFPHDPRNAGRPAGLPPRRSLDGAPLGRHGRPLHAVGRRDGAAREGRRPLRRHEGRGRRAARVRCIGSAAAAGRMGARLRRGARRLGQGRRQEHGRGPDRRTAPVPWDGRRALWRARVPRQRGTPGVPPRLPDAARRAGGISGFRSQGAGGGRRPAGMRRPALALLLAAVFLGAGPQKPGVFRDVTKSSGISMHVRSDLPRLKLIATMIGGCALGDYDGDGRLDLYVANSIPHWGKPNTDGCGRLYRNLGGGRFEDVTAKAGIRACGLGMGAFWADLDGDGRLDLYLTNAGPNAVWWNRGDGTFEEGRDTGLEDPLFSIGAGFLDYDGDGRVDVVVANYLDSTPQWEAAQPALELRVPEDYLGQPSHLFRNEGGRKFRDVTKEAGLALPPAETKTLGAAVLDYDGDGWPDLYFVNDRVTNRLFRNRGNGTFEEVTAETGAGTLGDHPRAGMGVAVGDPFGGGRDSLFVTNFGAEPNSLYRNIEATVFEDAGRAAGVADIGLPYVRWGTHFADFDNDGWADLYAAGGHLAPRIVRMLGHYKSGGAVYVDAGDRAFPQPTVLLHNRGGGRFEEWTDSGDLGKERMAARGSAVGDLDGDGGLDLVLVDLDGPVRVFRNEIGSRQSWIAIEPQPGGDGRTVLGTRVRVTAGERSQTQTYRVSSSYASGSLTPLHFGLGADETASLVEVFWPDGRKQVFRDVAARRLYGMRPGAELTPIAAR